MTQPVSQPNYLDSQPSHSEPSILCLTRKSGRPLSHVHSLSLPKLSKLNSCPVSQFLGQSSTPKDFNSLNHLRAFQQVHSSLVLGRYQLPIGSWCSPSTDHSELSDKSAKWRVKRRISAVTILPLNHHSFEQTEINF